MTTGAYNTGYPDCGITGRKFKFSQPTFSGFNLKADNGSSATIKSTAATVLSQIYAVNPERTIQNLTKDKRFLIPTDYLKPDLDLTA